MARRPSTRGHPPGRSRHSSHTCRDHSRRGLWTPSAHCRRSPSTTATRRHSCTSPSDLARLPALLAGQQPIRLETNGLGCTRETLLLGLLTTDPASRHLREQLDRLPGMQPGRRPLRELAFANVLRLNGPVAPELYRSIRHVRNTLAGEPLELGELTLVRTDKVGSPDRTEIIGRYLLSPRDPNTGNDAPAARRWT
jgi:hypothetical protein